jgi:hypothetical protein
MTVNCFVTSTGYGLSSLGQIVAKRYPRLLFEFVHPEDSEASVLTTIVPGPGRGVLQPVPKQNARELHDATKEIRGLAESAFSKSLEFWATYFANNRQGHLVESTRTAAREEQLALSRQQELWTRRILNGLLGSDTPKRVKRRIRKERMGSLLSGLSGLRDFDNLLTAAYSGPCRLDGPGKEDWTTVIESCNKTAESEIGKAVFQMRSAEKTIQYLGLWGRPTREQAGSTEY